MAPILPLRMSCAPEMAPILPLRMSCAPEMTPIVPLACRAKPEMTLFFVLAQENEDHPWFLLFVLPHHHTISQDISHATLRTRSVPVAAETKAMAILTHPSDLPRRIAHH